MPWQASRHEMMMQRQSVVSLWVTLASILTHQYLRTLFRTQFKLAVISWVMSSRTLASLMNRPTRPQLTILQARSTTWWPRMSRWLLVRSHSWALERLPSLHLSRATQFTSLLAPVSWALLLSSHTRSIRGSPRSILSKSHCSLKILMTTTADCETTITLALD